MIMRFAKKMMNMMICTKTGISIRLLLPTLNSVISTNVMLI